jgi:hypothetical protein
MEKAKEKEDIASHKEGEIAKTIEKETSKIPSDLFLWSALALTATSIILHACKQKHASLLVGQWAAPLLIMGLYNKVVKQSGHDFTDKKPI